ncbi:MAG: hypothetical protein COB02_05600 [Candidatus Cloacimonadota bacterium]|nr:MAG: hypothetical protein COB02_05600 [Candidatus Cloacimonadota bacterium]
MINKFGHKNILKAITFTGFAISSSLFADFKETIIFSNEFEQYLNVRANTKYAKELVERILGLKISKTDAKTVVSRIPFINSTEKVILMRMLDDQEKRNLAHIKTTSKKGEFSFINLGDDYEKRLILKKYLLSKVKTENEYEIVKSLFETTNASQLLSLYNKIDALTFLKINDKKVSKQIIEGKLTAYFEHQDKKRQKHSQEIKISSTDVNGFSNDLLKSDGVHIKARHHVKTATTHKGYEFTSDYALIAGNSNITKKSEYDLEHIRLAWKGDRSEFIFGDHFLDLGEMNVSREFRGIHASRKISSRQETWASIFVGFVEKRSDSFDDFYREYDQLLGVSLEKKYKNDKHFNLSYMYYDADDKSSRKNGHNISFSHLAKLSEYLEIDLEINSSYHTKKFGDERGGFGVNLSLIYDDGHNLSGLNIQDYSKDLYIPMGYAYNSFSQLEAYAGQYASWGSWDLRTMYRKDQETETSISMNVLRPSISFHLIDVFQLDGLYLDYMYHETREESDDRSRLLETNTHNIYLMKSFKRFELDSRIKFRETYDKLLSVKNEQETVFYLGTRGFYSKRHKEFSPSFFIQHERREDANGSTNNRVGTGADLSSRVGGPMTMNIGAAIWKNSGNLNKQTQQLKEAHLDFDYPLTESWDKSLKLSYRWQDQSLSGNLSHGSSESLNLSYKNQF